MAIEATQENFDQVITGPLTVVDFWAPWCGPCKMMVPILEKLAQRYKVMSIPSLVVFRNGIAKEKVTGVYPEAKLAHYFNRKLDEA